VRISVVGGGISGLTAAYRLLRAGHDVTCIDPGSRPGGLVRSERIKGFLCETGPQALLDNAPDTQSLIDELGIRDTVVPAFPHANRRLILSRGRLRNVPANPVKFLLSDALTWKGKWRLLKERKIPRRDFSARDSDETVLDFARRRLGDEAASDLIAPMMIGIYAGDAARLSVRACAPRMIEMETEHGSLLRALQVRRKNGIKAGHLFSFREGIETLPRALAAALGTRLIRARAHSIVNLAGKWMVDLATDPGTAPRPVPPSDHLILATGSNVTATFLDAVAPAAAVGLRQIRSVAAAVVCLGFSRKNIGMDLDAYGFLARRGEGVTILGCQYETTVFAHRAPENHVLLRVIVGGTFAPETAALPESELIELVLSDLARVAGLRANPSFTAVFRHPDGIPQYEMGHPELVRTIDDACREHPGLHLLGYSLHGISVNDCIRNATALCKTIA
jgi:protoporphyrinogen/coproporphyrinogen III oxidase